MAMNVGACNEMSYAALQTVSWTLQHASKVLQQGLTGAASLPSQAVQDSALLHKGRISSGESLTITSCGTGELCAPPRSTEHAAEESSNCHT